MTRDDLPPREDAYSIDAAESLRLAAEAMVALVPTKALYVPLNHKAGDPTDTQHFSPDNPLKGSWSLWAAIGMAIEGNHDSVCAFDLGSDWTDPYKAELRHVNTHATRPWARATSHVLRRLAHNFDTSDTSDQEGIRYTTIANDVHGEIDTQALAEALETLERENYVDLVHNSDARTAPPCDEDIVISKGPRYARGLARVEREMRSASSEHTPQGQRTARLYAAREMPDDLPLPLEHTPPRPTNNDTAAALVGTDLGTEYADDLGCHCFRDISAFEGEEVADCCTQRHKLPKRVTTLVGGLLEGVPLLLGCVGLLVAGLAFVLATRVGV